MTERHLQAPSFKEEDPNPVVGEYNAAKQAVGFGVPKVEVRKGSGHGKGSTEQQVLQAHQDLEVAMEHGEVVVGGSK
jgi:hypothetical protein